MKRSFGNIGAKELLVVEKSGGFDGCTTSGWKHFLQQKLRIRVDRSEVQDFVYSILFSSAILNHNLIGW